MTEKIATHAFVAGELDRPFYARTDLQKYPLGVALARNFTVDYRGGLKTRPGFLFLDGAFGPARLFSFPRGEGDFPVIVFVTAGRTFLWLEDEYQNESPIAVTGFSNFTKFLVGDVAPSLILNFKDQQYNRDAGTLDLADATSITPGDFVYLDGEAEFPFIFVVTAKAGNTITIASTFEIPFTFDNVTAVRRVKSYANPYGSVCLPLLRAHFRLNILKITCVTRPPWQLRFDDQFYFEPVPFLPALAAPTGLTATSYKITGTGAARVLSVETGAAYGVYAVTAVDVNGTESAISRPLLSDDLYNFTTDPGSAKLAWTAVSGAVSYNVYRSIITENELDIGTRLGFVGSTTVAEFIDDNFIPDFTRLPPTLFNPFADGAVLRISITAPGSGYDPNTTTLSAAGGTGFVGYPIVRDGKVLGALIVSGGSGYETSDALTVAAGGGTGATGALLATSPLTGNYPATNTIFQQRSVYAGSPNLPLTAHASRIGDLNNFSAAAPPSPDDAFSFTIDASESIPIRHLIRARNGLLMLHAKGVDRLLGSDNKAVSAVSRDIENQSDIGVGTPVPAIINDDVIFSTPRGSAIIAMGYTFYTNSYAPQDISVLAAHLFGEGKAPVRMEWISEPDKLLWVLREDGQLLTLTYMKEQEIFAWTQHQTAGFIHDIVAVSEPGRDALYALIERDEVFALERLAPRRISALADYIGTDRALVRTFEEAQSVIGGLWPLEGHTVSVLADADAVLELTVEDGEITLDNPANKVIIGIPYVCQGASLPLSDPELLRDGTRRRIVGAAVRLLETRGLEVGADLRALFEMKDKGTEDWGAPIDLRSDYTMLRFADSWKRDAQIHFRQRYPLPAHILGYVSEVEQE